MPFPGIKAFSIWRKSQRALDKAARRIGTRYDVYRLGETSNGSILSPQNRVFANVFFRMTLDVDGWTIEQTKIYDMLYLGMGSIVLLQIGDVLVDKDIDGAMYVLGHTRPLNPNVFCRVEIAGTLTRPAGEQVNGNASMPLQGRIGFQGLGKSNEQICVLQNGSFNYVPSGVPASIPMGLQPYKRLGGMPKFASNAPSMTHRNEVFAYIPLLPGIQIQPGDMLNAQNGDRYQIHTVTPFTTGIQGYQIIAESTFI